MLILKQKRKDEKKQRSRTGNSHRLASMAYPNEYVTVIFKLLQRLRFSHITIIESFFLISCCSSFIILIIILIMFVFFPFQDIDQRLKIRLRDLKKSSSLIFGFISSPLITGVLLHINRSGEWCLMYCCYQANDPLISQWRTQTQQLICSTHHIKLTSSSTGLSISTNMNLIALLW